MPLTTIILHHPPLPRWHNEDIKKKKIFTQKNPQNSDTTWTSEALILPLKKLINEPPV